MPLGIVDDSEFRKELGLPEEDSTETPVVAEDIKEPEVVEPEVVPMKAMGRGKGNTQVPLGVKKLIGETSIEEGSVAATAIGEFLGLSRSSVSAYSKGATSTATYNKPAEELADHLANTRKRITKRAAGKLFKALSVIDEDKLNELSALEASTVAKNMSAVIKQMEPESKHNHNSFNGPIITFYAPRMVTEDHFDAISISE